MKSTSWLTSEENLALLAIWTKNSLFIDSDINVKSFPLKINFKSLKDGSFSLNYFINSRIVVVPSTEFSLQN